MRVTRVRLAGFLSYSALDVELGEFLNILTGENASGKTNLVDSIHYSALGKSSRHNTDKELINWNSKEGSRVVIDVQKRFSRHEIDIRIDPQGKKRVLVDKLPLTRIGELMGILNVVFFSPNELKLVKGGPADRRRFIDISLCQQNKTYFYSLQRYNSLIQQRNKLLKTHKGKSSLQAMLGVINQDLVKSASFVISERFLFIERMKKLAYAQHSMLTNNREDLLLSYEGDIENTSDITEISARLTALLQESAENDMRLEYTTVGPHRDDIKMVASNVDIRKFGSQGQQRTTVLSLKLAEVALFRERSGEMPVLLLDDVLSELDVPRQEALFNAIDGIQTIVTCTEFDGVYRDTTKKFLIKDRKITELQKL